jgi:bifunctional non-homologous end joining protein LigD
LARDVPSKHAMRSKKLAEYQSKRDFSRTGEPAGGSARSNRLPRFVVQKHDSRSLHYDFRLEVDGVLKSWAVPKGPSSDPKVKRLAVPTEDHPFEYAGFEGVIPQPEYGAGTVMVWDYGTYRNLRDRSDHPLSMERSISEGKIEVELHGKKLKGAWVLLRTGFGPKGSGWLLKKMKDEKVPEEDPVAALPNSAKTGRKMEQIAARGTKLDAGS